jgi:hypothetical protein
MSLASGAVDAAGGLDDDEGEEGDEGQREEREREEREEQHSGARFAVSFSDRDGGKAFPPVGALRSPTPPSPGLCPGAPFPPSPKCTALHEEPFLRSEGRVVRPMTSTLSSSRSLLRCRRRDSTVQCRILDGVEGTPVTAAPSSTRRPRRRTPIPRPDAEAIDEINRVRRGRRRPKGSDGGEGFPPVFCG